MATSNVVVARISHIAHDFQRPFADVLKIAPGGAPSDIKVQFDDGSSAALDPTDAKTETYLTILDELRRLMLPVYAELDASGTRISRLSVPITVTVTGITLLPSGDADVTLEISHARHILLKTDPNFRPFLALLRAAQKAKSFVIVSETDDNHIIDVRPAPHPSQPKARRSRAAPSADKRLALRSVTPERAAELFRAMATESCNPTTVPAPCIPFLYPDDGCWARAHQMCRLMIAQGEEPEKIWLYGHLTVNTNHNPTCAVHWGYHIAPVLSVASGGTVAPNVIDPSLFNAPVTVPTWRGVQNDPAATAAFTDASVYYRSPTGALQYDPTYSQTAQYLAIFRLKLMTRAKGPDGPPPYANCP